MKQAGEPDKPDKPDKQGQQGGVVQPVQRRADARARKVRDALQEGDMKTAELLIHSLRGVAGQIGAIRVPLDAGALEQAIHESQTRGVVEDLLLALEDSLGELMAALDAGLPYQEIPQGLNP